jgi:hypothetical protein
VERQMKRLVQRQVKDNTQEFFTLFFTPN